MLKYILCLEGCFILSDKGYRCSKFSISPFFKNEKDDSLTDEECRHYDEVHRITRSSIERAIGKLKARVPLLSKGVNRKTPADIVDFVNAAVTFHQLCRYIELALNPSPEYVEHMKTCATDIPEFESNDGRELRRKNVKSVAKMKVDY